MREATVEPTFASAPAKRRKAGKSKKSIGLVRRLIVERPGAALMLGLAAAAAIGVPLNAMFLQDGRHPAPLFQIAAPAPQALEESTPLPPARPAALARAPKPATVAKTEAARVEPVRLEAAKAEAAPAKDSRDLIGQLLSGGAAPKASVEAATQDKAAQEKSADHTVLYAQNALARLGYKLRADGVFGGTTRQAIEKFERDIGLPVKGELTPKLLKRLAARSGLPNR